VQQPSPLIGFMIEQRTSMRGPRRSSSRHEERKIEEPDRNEGRSQKDEEEAEKEQQDPEHEAPGCEQPKSARSHVST
jgi:hypothetical protein